MQEAERLQAQETETASNEEVFQQYLTAKNTYHESRSEYRKMLRKLLMQRGSNVAAALVITASYSSFQLKLGMSEVAL